MAGSCVYSIYTSFTVYGTIPDTIVELVGKRHISSICDRDNRGGDLGMQLLLEIAAVM
jgi:hypothetical protein